MWKKKLHSLTPLSNNLLRRKRIAPPCTAATASEIVPNQNRLLEFASPISSSCKFQEHASSFSSDFYSSRAFHIPRLHFGPPSHTTKLFRFVSTSTSPAVSLRCWNCNALPSSTTPFLVCQSCRSVQPVDHAVDFFQILGVSVFFFSLLLKFTLCNIILIDDDSKRFMSKKILCREKRYAIEVEVLEGTYKDWQKKLHPDLVHTKSQV